MPCGSMSPKQQTQLGQQSCADSFPGRWRKQIAKLSFQDLAVTILRQGLHEVVSLRPLEPRDAIKTMSVELSNRDARSRFADYKSDDDLAPFRIVCTTHR